MKCKWLGIAIFPIGPAATIPQFEREKEAVADTVMHLPKSRIGVL